METLYDNLLEYYDEIFPLDQDRIDFVQDLVMGGAGAIPKILDVGCATGTSSLALMRRGMDVTGIDLNSAMVQSACRRNPEPRTNARFLCMNMMEISKFFPPRAFDAVLCLGNTLVHLPGPEEIGEFFKKVRGVLKDGGVFVFQVVNYRKVLDEALDHLPTVETVRSRFERKYRHGADGRIAFEGTIFSSSGQVVFRDTVQLYPATEDELSSLARAAGFGSVDFFSDFSRSPASQASLGLVGVASL